MFVHLFSMPRLNSKPDFHGPVVEDMLPHALRLPGPGDPLSLGAAQAGASIPGGFTLASLAPVSRACVLRHIVLLNLVRQFELQGLQGFKLSRGPVGFGGLV